MSEQTNPAPAGENSEPEKAPTPEPSPSEDEKKGAVPYSRFKEVVDQRQAAEETLKTVVDELVADLPEEFRPLVPNLPPAAKAAWIRQARGAGLFTKPSAPAAPELDTKRPGGKPPADLSKMNPTQLLSVGYK
jgi:hypothetical protein